MTSLSRRQFLRTAAVAAASTLSFPALGCGGSPGPVSTVPSDTVRAAYSALLPSLDPHAWWTAIGPRTLAPMFDALTFIQSDGKLRPSLAIAWAQIDALTWQFRLRVDDVKFHNGETFGPDSVRLTFDLLRGSQLPLAKLAATVERVDVVNPATINLTTQQPDSNLPRWISAIYMLPPRYFGQVGAGAFAGQPVGTGFWKLDDFQAGSRLQFVQFRDSWRSARGGDSAPVLKRLELEVLPDVASRAQALAALRVDVATELSADQANGLRSAGFAVQTTSLGPIELQDADWQNVAFGSPLGPDIDIFATTANVKGLSPLPDGAWWFDRVTKTEMQRIAVAGGA